MERWLDDLSEDWVSQPRSQPSSSSLPCSPRSDSDRSRSRIPKPKSLSFSKSSKSPLQSLDREKEVLRTRTPSQLNVSSGRLPNGHLDVKAANPAKRGIPTSKNSLTGAAHTLQGTVQHRSSVTEGSRTKATPEWKRRLAGAGNNDVPGPDLLSPKQVGLQAVFKPPTVKGDHGKQGVVKRRQPIDQSRTSPETRPVDTLDGRKEVSELRSTASSVQTQQTSELSTREPSSDLEKPGNIDPHERSKGNMTSELSGSDDFSPAIVSKQTTVDGRINYIAMESPKRRPSSNITQIFQNQASRTHSREEVGEEIEEDIVSPARQVTDSGFMDQSLPEDLSISTEAFVANGGYVSLKRGGYSTEEHSMQMPLSASDQEQPPLEHLERLNTPDGNRNHHFHPRNPSRSHSTTPTTPKHQHPVAQSSPERPRSSGSPLKLFDKYDTFTNERLLRRMSKFEETLPQDEVVSTRSSQRRPSTPSPGPKESQRHSRVPTYRTTDSSRVSSFGDGELDTYAFPEPPFSEPKLPLLPQTSGKRSDMVSANNSKRPNARLHRFPGAQDRVVEIGGRNPSPFSDAKGVANVESHDVMDQNHHISRSETKFSIHGKRLQNSPNKDNASKRLKTTVKWDHNLDFAPSTNQPEKQDTPSKSLVGRKRKDALYANEQQDADPTVLATRQIRRPRNPTPHHASSGQEPLSVNYEEIAADRHANEVTQDSQMVDPPTYYLADAIATVALNTAQKLTTESRKPSVTTADFFHEAQHIMSLIRAEKRPHSNHGNLETSVFGHQTIHEESMLAESTKDDFSRPPSREGSYPSRPKQLPVLDRRATSQLRKFEDHDELGLALSSSMKDLRLSLSRSPSQASVIHKKIPPELDQESDPPNIRILDRKQGDIVDDAILGALRKEDGEGDQRSASVKSEQSTKRSIPTGSSGSSTNRLVIAPEKVAHLLTDRMAGMVFDHERRVWEKAKEFQQQDDVTEDGHSENTEHDLFQDIPDLSVDEMKELQMVRDAVSAHEVSSIRLADAQDQLPPSLPKPSPCVKDAQNRPRTAEGKSILAVEDSSAPSKYSHFASSGPLPSTRATSWGDQFWPSKPVQALSPTLSAVAEHTGLPHEQEEVEHEISILEGRATKPPPKKWERKRQPRAVTVTFSSPPVDRVHSPDIRDTWTYPNDGLEDERSNAGVSSPAHVTDKQRSSSTDLKHRRHCLSQPFRSKSARSMSPLDENQERSLIQYSARGNRTIDVAISTPLPFARSLLLTSSFNEPSSLGFSLSPLADFTVHQADRPLEANEGVVARRSLAERPHEASNMLSLTAQNLIKHLTDLEPYEPYWEYVRSVDLNSRQMTSLHMLDEFCGQLERLDISNNHISELQGIPPGVRLMNASNNCLLDLSPWHGLRNLQYLDISGNELTTLKGLWGLVHLRGLKVDHNAVESLAGLESLDGLLSLSLRNNRLSQVDFTDFDL